MAGLLAAFLLLEGFGKIGALLASAACFRLSLFKGFSEGCFLSGFVKDLFNWLHLFLHLFDFLGLFLLFFLEICQSFLLVNLGLTFDLHSCFGGFGFLLNSN